MAENLTCSKETYGETKRLMWVISWLCIVPGFKRRDLTLNWKEGHGNVSDFCCLLLVFCHCLDLQMVNIGLRVLARPQASMLPDMYRKLGLDFDERVLPSIMNEVHSSCN